MAEAWRAGIHAAPKATRHQCKREIKNKGHGCGPRPDSGKIS